MENYVNELFDLINHSHSVYHNINYLKEKLIKEGYTELKESEKWNLEKNHHYFVIRSNASIIMFKVGSNPTKFNIVASHNDSPCYKLKPSMDNFNLNYLRAEVESYGGIQAFTWFDKPLSLAGRVMIKKSSGIEEHLVDLNDFSFIIPSLAPHVGELPLPKPSVQNELSPVLGTSNEIHLKDLLRKELKLSDNDVILSHDLYFYNQVLPTYIGMERDLIASPKLDDLECAYTSFKAFLKAEETKDINVCVIFNNEEIGSGSNNAAASSFVTDVFERICLSLNLDKYVMYASSMLVSADNAHAVHPARPNATDIYNPTYMNQGIVIKTSASLTYTSDAYSIAKFAGVLKDANVPYQIFSNNSDVRGGSTLGRILLMHLSITSVDIGLAQLSMHSNYELAGAKDITYMIEGLIAFYEKN